MNTCQWILPVFGACGKPCEGKNNLCATHARLSRKITSDAEKEAVKRDINLKKAVIKSAKPRPKPKPVSDKRKIQNAEYLKVREQYLIYHWKCEANIKNVCDRVAIETHHSAGRSGDLLTETKYFIAVCRGCHDYIHQHPLDALKRGLSVLRLATNQTI